MELLHTVIDLFMNLDKHLEQVIGQYGLWTYLILFVIIFCETGLVVMPLLPGDSLLFAAGTFTSLMSESGKPVMNLPAVLILLTIAAILGDTVNYWIGKYLGPWVLKKRILKRAHLDKTHAFFEKYGGKTIILARFVPIVRTFAPFVAGLGAMTYSKFILFNVVGGIAWVAICVMAGHWFGQLPFVKKNFELVVLAIIFISILPGIIEYLKHRRAAKSATAGSVAASVEEVAVTAAGAEEQPPA